MDDNGIPGKTFVPVQLGRRVAKFGQEPGQTSMCFGAISVEAERGLIVMACLREIAVLSHKVGETDATDQIVRMVTNRVIVDRSRGEPVAAGIGQRTKFMQRGQTRRIET